MIGTIALVYVITGLLFGIAFLLKGYKVIDAAADGAGLAVRLMWFPAAAALWPLMLTKWIKAGRAA